MIDPKRFENLENRVEKLEQKTEPIKVTRIEIDTGDVRERFDRIEQKQADQSEKLDILTHGQQRLGEEAKQSEAVHFEVMVKTVEDSANEIKAILADHSERFDTLNHKLDEILLLLRK